MADESKVDTSQLVGSSPADRQTDPHVDPLHALDPAKNPPPPEKPVKGKRAPAKRRRAARAKAADVGKDQAKAAASAAAATAKAAAAASAEGRAAYEAAKLNQVEAFASVPANAEAFQLRFAALGEFVAGAMGVARAALQPAGQGARVTYNGKVEFGGEGAAARITEAWLIASSGEAVCCDLGVGLPVGGGHHAEIPANHLLF